MWSESRTCTGCRKQQPRAKLLRFVADERGHLRVDPLTGLHGRGVYTCPTVRCVAAGIKKGGFARGLKRKLFREDPERLMSRTRDAISAELTRLRRQALEDGRARRSGAGLVATDPGFGRRFSALMEQGKRFGVEVPVDGQNVQDPSVRATSAEDSKLHEGQHRGLPANGRE